MNTVHFHSKICLASKFIQPAYCFVSNWIAFYGSWLLLWMIPETWSKVRSICFIWSGSYTFISLEWYLNCFVTISSFIISLSMKMLSVTKRLLWQLNVGLLIMTFNTPMAIVPIWCSQGRDSFAVKQYFQSTTSLSSSNFTSGQSLRKFNLFSAL